MAIIHSSPGESLQEFIQPQDLFSLFSKGPYPPDCFTLTNIQSLKNLEDGYSTSDVLLLPHALSFIWSMAKMVNQGKYSLCNFMEVFPGKINEANELALQPILQRLSEMYFPHEHGKVIASKVNHSLMLWDTLKYSLISTEIASREKHNICSEVSNPHLHILHGELQSSNGLTLANLLQQKSAFETATDSAMEELLEWNSRYKDKFRFIFIICASGRGMPEILDQLKKRFQNRPIVELDIAIGEEMKIIELRLAKLFKDDPVEKLKDVSGGGSIQHHRPRITTHVLDVSRGCPASGVEVYLEMWKDSHKCPSLINGDPSKWVLQGSSHTDRDGRSGPLMSIVDHTNPGFYRLSFNTGKYASSCFYPYVSIVFEVKERQRSEHFHVPLLFSPFSFSTYRGS